MGFTKLILKFAAPLPKIEKYTRYLFIGPHPDDIEIGAGATASVLVSEKKKVTFLICTDGRFGGGHVPDLSTEELIKIRHEESLASAKKLGVTDVRFLDFCDGGFYNYDDLAREIAGVVGEVQPEVIFAPDPSVTSETHKDHLNVGKAAMEIANFAPYPGIMKGYHAKECDVQAIALYMTAKPTRFVKTTGHLGKQMESVFETHFSQFPKDSSDASSVSLYLKLRAYEYGLRTFHRTAEGFRVLGKTHMHCLPEAGK